jgi:hypothetical protein
VQKEFCNTITLKADLTADTNNIAFGPSAGFRETVGSDCGVPDDVAHRLEWRGAPA